MRNVKGDIVSENDNKPSTSDFMRAEKEILQSYQLENFKEQYLAWLETDSQDNTRRNYKQKKITLKEIGPLSDRIHTLMRMD